MHGKQTGKREDPIERRKAFLISSSGEASIELAWQAVRHKPPRSRIRAKKKKMKSCPKNMNAPGSGGTHL